MNGTPWFLPNALRFIFSALDSLGYFFLDAVYNIFFTVASAQIFQGSAINTFYSRVQLILGIFMIFKLSLTLLQIIINPDLFKDKQKGVGSLATRIAVMILMLSLIVPISIPNPGNNPLNQQINDNGILFGFLYQFQSTIIEENILGKIVLGAKDASTTSGDGLGFSNMVNIGERMAFTVASAFVKPTLKDGVDEKTVATTEDYQANVACSEKVGPYFSGEVTAESLLDHLNDTCKPESSSKEVYAFDYTILGGLICSIIMTIIILGFTIDVAVRAVKLAILRLIAPIPIISYIDPAQGKDGPFNNWIKTLTSTYLSLFIRLIVIYFGIYLIVLLTDYNDDLSIWQNSVGVVTSLFATIFVIIGILMFMKEAPKFFQDMLGIKGDGKLFSGIGTMLGAAALTGGLAGSVISSTKTGYAEGQERGYSKLRSGWRAARAGVGGFLGGAYAGGKALMTNDKKQASAVFAAMQRRNAVRAGGSTLFGRTRDSAQNMFLGSSPVDKDDAMIEGYNNFADLYKSVAAKADVDDMYEVNVGGSKHTVKDLKETYERLVNSNASAPVLKHAQDAYKRAQEEVINAAMNGTYESGVSAATRAKTDSRPFLDQMQIDIDNARKINERLGLDLDMSNAKQFKISSFDAGDRARNKKNSASYKSRKSSQSKK